MELSKTTYNVLFFDINYVAGKEVDVFIFILLRFQTYHVSFIAVLIK